MGRKRHGAVRSIVVKFHRYGDRKKVRIKGYNSGEELKAKKLSCRVQWPK